MKIVRADTEAMRTKIFRFRYRIFCEEIHMLDPTDYPDGMEFDDYDRYAEQYAIVEEGGEIVGSFRLVLQNPVGFPGLDHMRMQTLLERYDPATLGEISRIAIAKERRSISGTIELLKTLQRYGCPYLKRRGVRYIFCAVEETLYRLFRMTDLPFEKIGEGRVYFGKMRYIAMLDMKELARRHPLFCRY